MNFLAVAIVLVIVLGHPFNKSRLLIGLNRILFYFNSSQITKKSVHQLGYCVFGIYIYQHLLCEIWKNSCGQDVLSDLY